MGGGGGGGSKVKNRFLIFLHFLKENVNSKKAPILQNRGILKTREMTVIYFFGVFLILIGEYRGIRYDIPQNN